jgi:stage V sporulation protein B
MGQTADVDAAQVAKGSIYLTLQNIISPLIGVFGFAFLARAVTTNEMGVIAGLLLLLSLVPLLSEFGLNTSILKHVSELFGKGESISGIVISASTFRLIVGAVAALAVYLAGSVISETLFKTTAYSFIIGILAIDILLMSITPLQTGILLGAGKMRAIFAYGTASIAVRWVAIVIFLIIGLGIQGVVIGWILGDIVLLALNSINITSMLKLPKEVSASAEIIGKSIHQETLPMLKFAWPLYAATIVGFLYSWYDKAIVLAALPLSDLGIYNTAYTAFILMTTISGALGSSLLPFYGRAYARKDHQAISNAIRRSAKYTTLIIFPLTLALLAAANPVLVLFAGAQYESGWTTLAILAAFGLVFGIAPAFTNILLVYGKTKTLLLLSILPVILSLAMLPLVWTLGLNGLAILRGTGFLLNLALTAYFVNKLAKISLNEKTILKTLVASIAMAAVMVLLQQIIFSKYIIVIVVLVGAAVYVALIRVLKILNQDDFDLLSKVIGKKPANIIKKILI